MQPKSGNRQVIMINGDNSKWYEQAIFILRSNAKKTDIDLMKEAEKIINNNSQFGMIADYNIMEYNVPESIYTTKPIQQNKKIQQKPQVIKKESKKQVKKSRNLDFMLNFAIILVAMAIVWVVFQNFV